MLRAYKTEIRPTEEQKKKINQSIGICRWLYNEYLGKSQELYNQYKEGLISKKEARLSANSFDKYINNEVKILEDYNWINLCGSKARKKADRYFVSVVVEEEVKIEKNNNTKGLGIDLGLKEFAVISDGTHKKNINKTAKVKKVEKKLKREQKKLSRKYESLKLKNKKEKGDATRQNIQKQIVKVQRIHQRLSNIRTHYINKTNNEIVKQKPSYITIEDLNVRGMMKNRHLSKAVAQQKFYEFRIKLEYKCKLNGIELRIVDKFYPSSKTCSCCGAYKKDLKLSDRVYKCNECNVSLDRDLNASYNLENAKIYKVA